MLLSSVDPASGPLYGNVTVTVRGSNLRPRAGQRLACRFASTVVAATSISDDAVECITPSWNGTATVPLTLTLAGVEVLTGANASLSYDFVDLPLVSSVSPALGPMAGGTVITLSGSGLALATACLFEGRASSVAPIVAGSTVLCCASRSPRPSREWRLWPLWPTVSPRRPRPLPTTWP
jgi:hypothetical protein